MHMHQSYEVHPFRYTETWAFKHQVKAPKDHFVPIVIDMKLIHLVQAELNEFKKNKLWITDVPIFHQKQYYR